MKKILGFVIAVGMIAAGIAPAMASDVELSGEIRVRHEITTNSDWNDSVQDGDNETTQRTRLNAKVAVDDQTTAFISLADVRTWGEDTAGSAANTGNEGIGLNEGWLQIDNVAGPVGVKIGRQRLSYGKQRMLGALEWTDEGNRWDALNFLYRSDNVSADLFFAERSTDAVSLDGTDYNLNGLYVTLKDIVPANTADVYVIQKTGANEMDFLTTGVRLAGKAMNIDWDVEYAVQSGDYDTTTDMGATAMVVEVGYTLTDVMGLRIGAQIFEGEGDETGGDKGWDNLHPTNHFKYGIADKEGGLAGKGGKGLEGVGVSVSFKPLDGVSVKAEYLTFESENDGTDLGEEINIGVKFSLTDKVKVYAYAAQFEPDVQYVGATNDEYEKVGIMIGAKF